VLSVSVVLVAAGAAAGDAALVSMLTSALGVDESQAAGGAGALLAVAQQQLGGESFGQISAAVPEVAGLVDAAPELGGAAASAVPAAGVQDLLGQGSDDMIARGLQLAGAFEGLGLDPGMVQSFTPVMVDYVRDRGGDGVGGLLSGALTGGAPGSGLSGLASSAPLLGVLTEDLGVSSSQAVGGAGALLGLAQSQLSEDDFGSIVDAVPGVLALVGMAPEKGQGSGGDLLGAAGALLGDSGGSGGQVLGLLGLADTFDGLGLDSGMVERFVPLILSYVQSRGGDAVSGLLAGVLGGGAADAPESQDSPGAETPAGSKPTPAAGAAGSS
jgi:hypothetical protein